MFYTVMTARFIFMVKRNLDVFSLRLKHGSLPLIRGDVKIPSFLPQTFHKCSQNHLKGSVTQLVTSTDFSQNVHGPLPIHYIVREDVKIY